MKFIKLEENTTTFPSKSIQFLVPPTFTLSFYRPQSFPPLNSTPLLHSLTSSSIKSLIPKHKLKFNFYWRKSGYSSIQLMSLFKDAIHSYPNFPAKFETIRTSTISPKTKSRSCPCLILLFVICCKD